MARAMEEAISLRARDVHMGWCIARNITHAGAIGYFAQIAARAGMAGMVMIASRPMMAYHGARVPALSTNPLAIAVPGGKHPPLALDMSSSTVSMGKVLEARDAGQPIPDGWGMDADGRMTNDPNQVSILMPLGGAKGSSLSLMFECLVSLLGANPLIEPILRPGGDPSGFRQNGLCVAIDISAFVGLDDYQTQVDDLATAITALPKADGVEQIYAPGERGDAILAERTRRTVSRCRKAPGTASPSRGRTAGCRDAGAGLSGNYFPSPGSLSLATLSPRRGFICRCLVGRKAPLP